MQFLFDSRIRDRRGVSIFAALMAAGPLALFGAPPVIDEPVPVNSQSFPTHVEPRVPVGKALIFPITAADPEGKPLKYTVTSSNPKVTVSVRTGLPKMKMQIEHAGDGTEADPAFSGELEFSLLRDLAPKTVDKIGGLSQGHFYHNLIFHRIADLDPNEEPEGSYILQGGDPRAENETNPDIFGSGGPGFKFDNEFHPSAIFTGRGQLAMANAGSNTFDNRGTNGSQFFITIGQPRFLDFNHNIFGQLLRGWDVVEQMADVLRFPAPTPPAKMPPENKPQVPLRIVSSSIEPDFADAILLISATATGTSTITVKVTDPDGEEHTRDFEVTAFKDEKNSPPFLFPVPNQTVAKEKVLGVPLRSVDLERDYTFIAHSALFTNNVRTSSGGPTAFVLGNAGFVGQANIGLQITQFDPNHRGPIDGPDRPVDDKIGMAVAVGDKQITAEAKDIGGTPGAEITNALLATYVDGDPAASPSDFTAKVIWGDGTYSVPTSNNNPNGDARFDATITRDPNNPFPGAFVIKATHTYQHAGIYPVAIELNASKGQRVSLRSTAVVSAGNVRAFGKAHTIKGKTLTGGVLATFTDSVPATLNAYSVVINWGDGDSSAGTVSRSLKGELQIQGTHTFPSEGEFAPVVELTKAGDPNTPAVAWSRVEVTEVKGPPVLPPYDTANLVGQMGDADNIGNPVIPVKTGSQYSVPVQLVVVNAGTKPTRPGKLRFYLSEDNVTNTEDETGPDPENPGSTIVINPKDIPVKIGKLKEVKIQSLPPGAGVRYIFDRSTQGDFRLKFPAGEGGHGLSLLAHFVYSDPLGDFLPIAREVAVGPFNPFIVSPTSLTVKEMGGAELSQKFSVKLARQPRADVVINITLNATAALEITAAPTTLTFTPENWNTPQEVTVTAKDDENSDTRNVFVTLGTATSTDQRFNNQDPPDVLVAVKDKASP
jgi:cyclophilin family peptidyl-prolyl cis-trans isomerase